MGLNCPFSLRDIFFGKIDCYYCLPTVLCHTTILQKYILRVDPQTKLHSCGTNWTQVALSIKGNFFGKVYQLYFGLFFISSCYIISKKVLREHIMTKRLHNFFPICPLTQKGIFMENWLILLMSNCCISSC